VMTSDGNHAFQVNTRDYFDADLVRSTLAFALDHHREVLAAAPLAILPGFSPKGSAFDTVVAIAPSVHEEHKFEYPNLHEVTYSVYPTYRCEFSGSETHKEVAVRDAKMVDSANLRREPAPVVRLRYINSKTQGRTLGEKRGLASPSVLFAEIRKLENAPASFIEFENYLGQIRKVTWEDGFILWNGSELRKMKQRELISWVQQFILHGVKDSSAA